MKTVIKTLKSIFKFNQVKSSIRIIIFLVTLFFILNKISTILTVKNFITPPCVNSLIDSYVLCDRQDGFYDKPPLSLDVVFLGSSNIHCNINPNIIWHEYGITSYDFSSDQQELGTTYYYLKQVFETQKPQMVLIDILNDGSVDELETAQAHWAFDHMKNDLYKFEGILDRTKTDRFEILFPIIAYHQRWNELTADDFLYKPLRHNILNGSFIYMSSSPQTPSSPDPTILDIGELSEKTIVWIDKITDLCNNNNCRCVFIKTPMAYYDEEFYAYLEAFSSYCDSRKIDFINLGDFTSEIGLNYATDYMDNSHLNWYGQQKLSKYLGQYIKNNCHYFDKRGNSEYSEWDTDYSSMMYYIDNFNQLSLENS